MVQFLSTYRHYEERRWRLWRQRAKVLQEFHFLSQIHSSLKKKQTGKNENGKTPNIFLSQTKKFSSKATRDKEIYIRSAARSCVHYSGIMICISPLSCRFKKSNRSTCSHCHCRYIREFVFASL